MASPGEVGFFDKIWDDLIDHIRNALRVFLVEPVTIGDQPIDVAVTGQSIEVTTAVGAEVQITDGVDTVSVETLDGQTSIPVVRGHHHAYAIHLEAENVGAKTGFMVINLSNTVIWPHVNTGHVHVEHVHIAFNPEPAFRGSITLGFLMNVDATNGDLVRWFTWHFDRAAATLVDDFKPEARYSGADLFAPIDSNDTTWQTDTNLQGPDGLVAYPSGDGDLVLLVERTAGVIDVSISVGYNTDP